MNKLHKLISAVHSRALLSIAEITGSACLLGFGHFGAFGAFGPADLRLGRMGSNRSTIST
jgi:hypothetical protein